MPELATRPEVDHTTACLALIGIDIACPGCEYNLRGLPGPVVECPECGLHSDVAVLAARQWTKPWYRAPGFNTLTLPAVCVWLSWFVAIPVTIAAVDGDGLVTGAVCLAWLALWIGLMIRAYSLFDSMRGLWLALAMHVLVASYLFSILGLAVLIILMVSAIVEPTTSPVTTVLSAMGTVFLFVVLWVSRRGERAIAQACIRQYLRRKPAGG